MKAVGSAVFPANTRTATGQPAGSVSTAYSICGSPFFSSRGKGVPLTLGGATVPGRGSAGSPTLPTPRHRLTARRYRQEMTHRFTIWRQITGTTNARRLTYPAAARSAGQRQGRAIGTAREAADPFDGLIAG